MTGPSAIGSLNGKPISTIPAPAGGQGGGHDPFGRRQVRVAGRDERAERLAAVEQGVDRVHEVTR